ncbi:RidA family protein [Stratiformator vulcanicus]|uniref:Endoribonuclease L-PSP n=1 Tax=Stratiformator vulcanicus TaxID=2527980 RepID=A0A517QXE2_9PLAN|nr:RidA family protein [Stratiformator vulcanicus]QDT36336.1 Endoribonuclease L-PSP [Stratiformator vulcanicus]
MSHEARLAELNVELPEPPAPAGNYVPIVRTGNLLFTAGHIAMIKGKVGGEVDPSQAHLAANSIAHSMLATLKRELGSLDKVKRLVKATGFVACTPDFTDHPKVIDGFSYTMAHVFGDAGKGARSAVGVPSLPLNTCVEIEAVWEVE